MKRHYRDLWATSLTQAQHLGTCGYWFTVTTGSMAHTAFATRAGLDRWLEERGLKLENPLADAGTWSTTPIVGEYAQEMHFSMPQVKAWFELKPVVESRTLSNGDYVEARITDNGHFRTVHTLNPNIRNRTTFDYTESRKLMS